MGEVERDPPNGEEPCIEVPINYGLLSGDNTSEAFSVAREYAEGKAVKFWGLQDIAFFSPLPVNLPERLNYMKRTLGKISSIQKPEYQDEQDWVTLGKRKKVSALLRITNRNLRISKKVLQHTQKSSPPLTYSAALATPDIKYSLLDQLSFLGDPKIAVIRAFDDWMLDYLKDQMSEDSDTGSLPKLDSEKILKGFEAFRLFLFGAGGKGFLKALRTVTIEYLQDDTETEPSLFRDRR